MAAGHHQEYDLFTDEETREQADIQRRELAESVQRHLIEHCETPPSHVEITRLVRSYTIAFRAANGGSGMVLIWSARNAAVTFQGMGGKQPPQTNVFHQFDALLRCLSKLVAPNTHDRLPNPRAPIIGRDA